MIVKFLTPYDDDFSVGTSHESWEVFGLDGNDIIWGGNASDIIHGGNGNDDLHGTASNPDVLWGDEGNDRLTGSGGDDQLNGGNGNDAADGGEGNDTINGDGGDDLLDGYNGNDVLDAGTGADVLYGDKGNDRLIANGSPLDGTDRLDGGEGDDVYVVLGGANIVVNDIAGYDRIEINSTYSLEDAPSLEDLTLTGSSAINGAGNAGNNVVVGNDADNQIAGNAGNDHLRGGGGTDLLAGGQGADVLVGGIGNDLLDGGDDIDLADYSASTYGIFVLLKWSTTGAGWLGVASGVDIGTDTLVAVENVTTGSGADSLIGDDAANVLKAGSGSDNLTGGYGNDILDGEAGVDAVDYSAATRSVTVHLASRFVGGFLLFPSASGLDIGTDSLFSIERAIGGSGDDLLDGNSEQNVLVGNAGNDTLIGRGGNDTLNGGTGSDTADYSATTQGITANLGPHQVGEQLVLHGNASGSEIGSDGLFGIENIIGGSGNDMLNGDGTANRLVGGGGSDAMDGGGGNDTVDYSTTAQGVIVYLGPHAIGNTGYLTGTANGAEIGSDTLKLIENVIGGSGNDELHGDGGDNRFVGGRGGDTLDGGSGIDTADYSSTTQGVTVFTGPHAVGSGFSTVGTATGSEIGSDTLRLIENIIGGSGNDTIIGDGSANTFVGGLGNDVMDGGAGFDFVDYSAAAGPVTVDLGPSTQQNTGSAGLDTLQNFEGVIGSAFADVLLRGFASTVILRGGDGGDQFHDHNFGDDTFDGGTGSDTINYITGGGESVVVNLTSGRATSVGGSVNTLVSIENAVGSDGGDRLTGDGGVNRLEGRGGNDILDGAGSADVLVGGLGNDLFFVDTANDRVVEAAGEGVDRVLAHGSYALAAGEEIEQLTTDNTAATTAINLTGNNFANTIHGNAGANVINGGTGADVMSGFGGNDLYFVDNAADAVVERAGEGTADRVLTSVSYTLAANQDIELFTTDNAAAVTAINLTGNNLANTIHGNAGANTINGGTSNDILRGFGGADTFAFTTALNAATNVDIVQDFSVADDTIVLENAIFTQAGAPGTLSAAAFFIGAAAHDVDDRIIYNAGTGALLYDADGNGAGAAVQFAKLSVSLALTNADFVVI